MPRIATRHAHQLAYRQRFSVGVRMLGCLVLLAGSLVLIAAAAEATKGQMSKTSWLAVALGLALVACGMTLLAGERGKLIDRERRTISRWWGIMRPLWYSTRDVQTFQVICIEAYDDVGVVHWRVSLFGSQEAPLELFDLPNQQAAEGAARQVAGFLSLDFGPQPSVSRSDTLVAPTMPAVPPDSALLDDRWIYWRPWPGPIRLTGVGLLSVAGVFLLAAVVAILSHDARWLIWMAIAVPLVTFGLWLVCGGRKIEIDRTDQTARLWRAWPWRSTVSQLSAFSAVVVAPTVAELAEGELPMFLVGLIGPEMRLELMRSLSCDEARAAAAQLAAVTSLPLIDESQPAVRSL